MDYISEFFNWICDIFNWVVVSFDIMLETNLFNFLFVDLLPMLVAAVIPIYIISSREKSLSKTRYYRSITEGSDLLFEKYVTHLANFILMLNPIVESNILVNPRSAMTFTQSQSMNNEYAQVSLILMRFTNLYNRLIYEIPNHPSLPYLEKFIDDAYKEEKNLLNLNRLLRNEDTRIPLDEITIESINKLRPKLQPDYFDNYFQFLIQLSDKIKF